MLNYIYLAAAVVVAIGIGVTGIMLIRRRRWVAEDAWLKHAVVAPAREAAPAPTFLIGPEPAAAPPAAPEPEPAPEPVPAAAPAPEPALVPEPAFASALADPLGMVILDLVDGQGKLSGAELKRLEVFRPDRIESAIQSIEFPSRLQADEDALFRLAQIQLYAASLQLRAKWFASAQRRVEVSDTPLTAHDFKRKIAQDILDLPVSDRKEVIGYLLGGLLNSPDSHTALKRAIIDTLEHLRSAALANVLLDCLDDPDPIVRDYALVAAERLLDG